MTGGELDIRDAPGGATLRVRVAPGSSRDRLAGLHGTALKVAVSAPPERGRANAAVARLLARALGVRAADVEVVAGPGSRDKVMRVRGWTSAALRERLRAILAP